MQLENPHHTTKHSPRARELLRLTYHTQEKVVKCQTFQCRAHTLSIYRFTIIFTDALKNETLLCVGTVLWYVETFSRISCVCEFCTVVCSQGFQNLQKSFEYVLCTVLWCDSLRHSKIIISVCGLPTGEIIFETLPCRDFSNIMETAALQLYL